MNEDYQIKKALVGISALLQADTNNLPQTIHALLPQISQTAATLCIRSVEVRTKNKLLEQRRVAKLAEGKHVEINESDIDEQEY